MCMDCYLVVAFRFRFWFHRISHNQPPARVCQFTNYFYSFFAYLTVRPHFWAFAALAHQYEGPQVHGLLPTGSIVDGDSQLIFLVLHKCLLYFWQISDFRTWNFINFGLPQNVKTYLNSTFASIFCIGAPIRWTFYAQINSGWRNWANKRDIYKFRKIYVFGKDLSCLGRLHSVNLFVSLIDILILPLKTIQMKIVTKRNSLMFVKYIFRRN